MSLAAAVYKLSTTLIVFGTMVWVFSGCFAWLGYDRLSRRWRQRARIGLLRAADAEVPADAGDVDEAVDEGRRVADA